LINNRQQQQGRRRRGRGPQGSSNNNGGRNEGGSRIDSRARGNAPQMLEKFKNLARDAQQQGDRVMTEYYLQFADHYFRIVAEQRARFEETRRQRDDWQGDENEEPAPRGANDLGDDDEDDGGYEPREQQEAPRREARPRNDRNTNDRGSNDRNSGDRSSNDRSGNDRSSGERSASDRGNSDRNSNDRGDRNSRPRSNGNYRDNGNRGNLRETEAESVADTIDVAVLPPAFASDGPMTPIDDLIPSVEDVTPAPKRRGRPKKAELVDEG
jgi:Domain of unknown function (DUF4167)